MPAQFPRPETDPVAGPALAELMPGAWAPLPLATGIIDVAATGEAPARYRREGDLLRLSATLLTGSPANDKVWFTLPEGVRPTYIVMLGSFAGNNLVLRPNGEARAQGALGSLRLSIAVELT